MLKNFLEQKKPLIKNKKIAVTFGDPSGIGPEVCLKAVSQLYAQQSHQPDYTVYIIGRQEIAEKYYNGLLNPFTIKTISANEISEHIPVKGELYFLENEYKYPMPVIGEGTVETALESKQYIDLAIDLCRNKVVDAMVTGPVSKSLIEKTGIKFMGHTEYIAEQIGENSPYMMMFSGKYRVLLTTTHYPVFDLKNLVNEESIYRTIITADSALTKIDGRKPLIAVAGLDPHCGDDGAIGAFDRDITSRAIARAVTEGINAVGPISADTLFIARKWEKFSVVIAHYHDQGLIPFKMLAFEDGVNVTLGLSIIRTSVDHGTAFDIAGRNIASCGSMVEAIQLASKL